MANRLGPDGLFVANVLTPLAGPGIGFLQRFRATLDDVFTETRVYRVRPEADPGVTQNLVVVAAKHAGALPDVVWPEASVGPAGRPLTDAWAPVEYLQAKVFLRGLGWS